MFGKKRDVMVMVAPLLPAMNWVRHVEIVEQACRDANITKDRAARIYGTSPQQFDQQIRGVGHFSVPRLCLMTREEDGRKFFFSYWKQIAIEHGLGDIVKAVELRDFICSMVNEGQKTMARAELREHEERKRA